MTRRVDVPLLPFWRPKEDFETFKLIQDHACWSRKLDFLTKRQSLHAGDFLSKIREVAMQGEVLNERNLASRELKSQAADCKSLLQSNPLGPENLWSNCMRTLRKSDGSTHLAYAHANSVLVKKLDRSFSSTSSSIFRHRFDEEDGECLANYDLPTDSRVYGFDIIGADPLPLFAIRHRRAATLLDAQGDILKTWKNSRVKDELLSLTGLPLLDSLATLDSSGTLVIHNLETLETVTVWENEFERNVEQFFWASLSESDNASVLKVATRKQVCLFDTRTGAVSSVLFEANNETPTLEVIGAVCNSKKHTCQFYCATSEEIHLVDERYPKPVQQRSWLSPCPRMPVGCDSIKIEGDEYLMSFSADGAVDMVFVEHEAEEEEQGELVTVFAIKTLFNMLPFSSTLQEKYLRMPWTGLTLLSDNPSELFLFSLNAAGTVFSGEIVSDVPPGGSPSKSVSDIFNSEKTVEDKVPWLNTVVRRRRESIEYLKIWDKDVEVDRYPKKSVAYALSRRDHVPLHNPLGVVAEDKRKKEMTKKKKKKEKTKADNSYGACPWLKPMDISEHCDAQGQRVNQIFEGEPIFPQLTGTDSDAHFSPAVSPRRTKSRSSRTSSTSSRVSLPSDTEDGGQFTMEKFMSSLHPFMTSTQETAEEEMPATPLIASQQSSVPAGTQQNDLSMQTATTPRRQKKGARFRLGF